jgi:PAS domain S-box-containing protein
MEQGGCPAGGDCPSPKRASLWLPFLVALGVVLPTVVLWRTLSLLPEIVLAAGFLTAVLLALTVQFARTAQARTAEAQAASNSVRESQERLQSILDNSRSVIYLKDRQGRYILINQWFEILFHIAREQVPGKTDHDLFPKEMADKFRANDQAVLEAGGPMEFEEVAPHEDGPHTYISSKFPLYDPAGIPYAVCGISTDITERKRTQEKLAALNASIEQRTAELAVANNELEAFSHSVSHDLRAPLRTIEGFSRMLLEDYGDKLDERGQHYLRRMRAGTERMDRLIEDLLGLSRVARSQMCRARVDLSALAEQVAAELRQRQPERQATLRITPGLVATGDAGLLRVVLENLLGNAWKYTSKHPTAQIEFGAMRLADSGLRNALGIQNPQSDVVYFVRDDGAGFDPSYTGKLFGTFQRLHSATEFEGTGIGLATVRRIIHRHGGRVWAEGTVEHGATFYFTLPTG